MSKPIGSKDETLEKIDARIKATEEHLQRSGVRRQSYASDAVELLSETNATTGKSRLEELIEQMGKEQGIRDRYNDQVLPLLSANAPTAAQARRFIDHAAARADNSMRLNGVTSEVAAEFTIAGESKQDLNERVEGHMLKEHTDSLVGKRGDRLSAQQQKNAIEMDLFGVRLKRDGFSSESHSAHAPQPNARPFDALNEAILKQALKDAQVAEFLDGPRAALGKAGKLGFNASKPKDQQILSTLSRHRSATNDVAKDQLRLSELYELRGQVFDGSLAFDSPSVNAATRLSSDNLSPKTRAALARGEERQTPDMRLIDQLGREGLTARDALSLPVETIAKSSQKADTALQNWIQNAPSEPPSSASPDEARNTGISPLEARARARQEQQAAVGANPLNTRHTLPRDHGMESLAEAREATAQAVERRTLDQPRETKAGKTYGQ